VRRKGRRRGLYLLLGPASLDRLCQSGESFAGRLDIVEPRPLDLLKPVPTAFICTYLKCDVPQFSPRIPVEKLRQFWTMLEYRQLAPLDAAELACKIDTDTQMRRFILNQSLVPQKGLEPPTPSLRMMCSTS
jgi:uncharacterized protein